MTTFDVWKMMASTNVLSDGFLIMYNVLRKVTLEQRILTKRK